VELIQTHVSYLFLTDSHVYKIKKPVDFGFLNFSTLDRRRFYCEEEVRLNRRLCPDLYLAVVGVHATQDGASFTGSGPTIDYAVIMRRLPAHRMLDRLLREQCVSADDIRAIARTIGAFHLRAERNAMIDEAGSLDAIRTNCDENFLQTRSFCGVTLDSRDWELIGHWTNRFLEQHADAFAARVAGGFIRDCDGDIHTENINLDEDGTIYIFDCIEFNSRFWYSDTAADIAFLLMDFDYACRPEFGATFLEEYVRVTGDTSVADVLDFYKIYRAYVRGKVESLRLSDTQIDANDQAAAAERARRFFRLCRGYIARLRLRSTLFLTCGLTGTGKSVTARELSFELGVAVVSSDVVRKELAGLSPDERRREAYESGIYDRSFTERTYRTLLQRADEALSAERSIIIDATLRRSADRKPFRELASRCGAALTIIETYCPDEIARQRLANREVSPDGPSDGRWDVYLLQKDEFEPPEASEGTVLTIDTTRSTGDMVGDILEGMGMLS
jgi:hypothetical protein